MPLWEAFWTLQPQSDLVDQDFWAFSLHRLELTCLDEVFMLVLSKNTELPIELLNGVDNFSTAMGKLFPVDERCSSHSFKDAIEVLLHSFYLDLAHVENIILRY